MSPRLTCAAALLTLGMVAAVLMAATPHDNRSSASSLTEEAEFVSSAQAALWKFEREHGINDKEAYTARARKSIAALLARKAAPPGGILGFKATKSNSAYYQKEAAKGIRDPDAEHEDNILDVNAKRSAAEHAKWQKLKGVDDPIAQLNQTEYDENGRLQHIRHRKIEQERVERKEVSIDGLLRSAQRDLQSAQHETETSTVHLMTEQERIDKEHAHYVAEEAKQQAQEAAIAAKQDAARKAASKVIFAEEKNQQDHEAAVVAKQDAAHKAADTANNDVTIVRGTTHLSPPPSARSENHTDPKSGTTSDERPKDAKKEHSVSSNSPGMLCLTEGGLSDQELKDFSTSTVCVGWEIKRGIGLGDTVHMIKDFLEAPMNKQKIMHCLDKINHESRKIVKACLNQLPEKQRAGNPVVEFWNSVV